MLRQKKGASTNEGKPSSPTENVAEANGTGAMRQRKTPGKAPPPPVAPVSVPADALPLEEEHRRATSDAPAVILTKKTLLLHAAMAVVFVSLPMSEDDYKGAALIAVFNVVWTFLIHNGGWLDYLCYVLMNALLAVYCEKIIEVAPQVPGMLPPWQWAVLLSSNGSILFGYWWKIIRHTPLDERETQWNIVTMGLMALDCAIGLAFGFITVEHLLNTLIRLKNLLTTGTM